VKLPEKNAQMTEDKKRLMLTVSNEMLLMSAVKSGTYIHFQFSTLSENDKIKHRRETPFALIYMWMNRRIEELY
jgi:hypothetical protein